MAESVLSLAVNGREHQLNSKLSPFRVPRHAAWHGDGYPSVLPSIAIVGLGYVGLPTAAALHGECERIIGIDVSEQRLAEIAALEADLSQPDQMRLKEALAEGTLELTTQPSAAAAADAVIICVPTPVDAEQVPDLEALRGACAAVVAHARPGQVIILTSTTYVGSTSELLTAPLAERGLVAGTNVHVAFSPERIDPGNPDHLQHETPRVVGGATAECTARAAAVIGQLTEAVYVVSSAEAAEATKLYENIFRAVSLALANEFADACGALRLDPIEVTLAAATKPYGFLGVFPGPGVGGHCIPCDPHYLLWQLGRDGHTSPLIEQAMRSISLRPDQVVRRAAEVLAADGRELAGSRVIVIGASYKAGVRDLRESSALAIIAGLARAGADVSYHDPLIPDLRLPGGRQMRAVADPQGADWDLAIVHTHQPEADYSWVGDCPRVLDATYQFDAAPHRTVLLGRRMAMKVLHVITGLGVGGAELQLRSMLQHTRHDAEVVTLYNPGPVADMIRADGRQVRSLGMTSNTQISTLNALRRLIADGRYDVVHTHLYRSQIYGRPAAWLAGVPVIVSTEHSIGETHLERRKMTAGVRALYLATEMMSDMTVAVSGTVRERLVRWGLRPRKVAVVPNGVDLTRVAFDRTGREKVRAEFGIAPSDYVIGVLGRLDPTKQFDMVIEAAAPLLGNGRRLLIVGEGDERAHLEEVARRCGVADRVIFAGERHDVGAMLSAMDLFVASSKQETFGLSVLEALASGMPVLYTTCPALDGLDVSRATQVPSSAGGLHDAMLAELATGLRADRATEPAVEKEYGIEAVTSRIDDLYEQLAYKTAWRTRMRGRPAQRRAVGTAAARG